MEEKVLQKTGKAILLGNEAIVRGALEAGVQFVSTYPGTPSSEVGNIFSRISEKTGVYFEFSTNEKVAMEAAAGASFSGLRSLVSMKSFGLNVASDFLLPLVYSGVKGGMVIFVADDPGCWSSAQSEENTRAYSLLSHIPTMEPATPQECKNFVHFAFELSERFKIPIMIRSTTRVSHQSAPVELSKIKPGVRRAKFIKDKKTFITLPPRVLEMHQELLDKIEILRITSEMSDINREEYAEKKSETGIITSGVSYLYVMEALRELEIELPVLKLGFFNPLPEERIKKFIRNLKKVLVTEELEPYLEKEIRALAKEANCKLEIFGKNLLPEVGEIKPEHLIEAIDKLNSKNARAFDFAKHSKKLALLELKKHSPRLCPGCPYHFVFSAVKNAVNPKEVVFGGEIGCYMLAGFPPYALQDYLFCMGSSVGIAHGIKKAVSHNRRGRKDQKLIAFVGDSSFFHAGIPALINAVNNKSNPLIIVLNNQTTAMTGQQPHPGSLKTANGEEKEEIKIADIVKACGVKHIKIVDPYVIKDLEKAVKDFLKNKEVSVIIARHPCLRLN